MKSILSILLVTLPVLFFAQDAIPQPQPVIGVTLGYDSVSGLHSEFRYDKHTSTGYIHRISFFTNYAYSYGLKLGIHKTIFSTDRLDLDLGFNLRFTRYTDKYRLLEGNEKTKGTGLGYEIPLNIRYQLSPTVDFNLGISVINQTQLNSNRTWHSGFNLGVSKSF